jgi:hypothetical protein
MKYHKPEVSYFPFLLDYLFTVIVPYFIEIVLQFPLMVVP